MVPGIQLALSTCLLNSLNFSSTSTSLCLLPSPCFPSALLWLCFLQTLDHLHSFLFFFFLIYSRLFFFMVGLDSQQNWTEQKVQRFPIDPLAPYMHSLPINNSPEQYIYYSWRTYTDTSIVYHRVLTWHSPFCRFGQMCNDMHSSSLCRTEYFH